MNIFVVHHDPIIAARQLNNKHVVKMIVEGCQMMTAVFHRYGEGHKSKYKLTHRNHPCTRWAGDSKQNFVWLWTHTKELCAEYTRRYGKQHKCEQYLVDYTWPNAIPDIGLTPFAQAMPDKYKGADAIVAYRDYYIGDKASFSKWKTSPPDWWPLVVDNS